MKDILKYIKTKIMTREQIEKESHDYVSAVYGDDGYFLPDYEDEVRDAFVDGAKWRINSVWHDAETETPRNDEPIIGITGKICCYMGLCGETAKEICPEMKKWAYISDIIPDRKEETNGGR